MQDAFELAVAVKIKNHKFRFPSRLATTLSSAASLGSGSISIVDAGGAIYTKVNAGDIVFMGESSNSSFSGKSEMVVVDSLSYSSDVTTITLTANLVYGYASGDSVVIYGSKHPESFGLISGTTPLTITPDGNGYRDRFAYLQKASGASGYFGFGYTFDSGDILPAVAYRIGFAYKYFLSGSGKLVVSVSDGHSAFLGGTPATASKKDWTEYSVGTTVSWPDLSSAVVPSFSVYQYLADSSSESYLWVDDIFLEHISGVLPRTLVAYDATLSGSLIVFSAVGFSVGDTIIIRAIDKNSGDYKIAVATITSIFTGGTVYDVIYFTVTWGDPGLPKAQYSWVEKMSGGYYSFDDYPTRDSLAYEPIELAKYIPNSLGEKYRIGSTFEDRQERWRLKASFKDVSIDIWNTIKRIKAWQDRGSYLNLHPHIPELPSVMTGFLLLGNFSKNNFDFNYCSFDMVFEEALV